MNKTKFKKKPDWLRVKLPIGKDYREVRNIVDEYKLNTICQSGSCPNMGECWGNGTATFMILGNICTRSCQFCNVSTGKPEKVDVFEPIRVAKSIKLMKLKHAVITSVDRDDLEDYGSDTWVQTVKSIRRISPGTTIETLIPDFMGCWTSLNKVINIAPEIVSHNMETVRRLSKKIRVQAKYDRSLEVLRRLKKGGMKTKSGIMLGLGETYKEILETLDDLKTVGCEIITIGQYLQPTKNHAPVVKYIEPDVFEKIKEEGKKRNFKHIESGALVRSSYHAEKHI